MSDRREFVGSFHATDSGGVLETRFPSLKMKSILVSRFASMSVATSRISIVQKRETKTSKLIWSNSALIDEARAFRYLKFSESLMHYFSRHSFAFNRDWNEKVAKRSFHCLLLHFGNFNCTSDLVWRKHCSLSNLPNTFTITGVI